MINEAELLSFPPKVRREIEHTEKQLHAFHQAVKTIEGLASTFVKAQQQSHECLSGIVRILLRKDVFPEPEDSDDGAARAMVTLSCMLDTVASLHASFAEELDKGLLKPLTEFLHADFDTLERRKRTFATSEKRHSAATVKYSRISKKKEDERTRFEANAELFAIRRDWHRHILEYVDTLNILSAKTKFVLVQPLLTWTRAATSFFSQCSQMCNAEACAQLTTTTQPSLLLSRDILSLAENSAERINAVVQECLPRYYPDPDPSDPFLVIDWKPADASVHEKEGYLFVRTSAVTNAWRHCFVRIAGGFLLMVEPKREKIIMQLRDARAHATTADDRRYVFRVQTPIGNKRITMQAESERHMQDWITVVENVAREQRIAVGRPSVFYTTRPQSESCADGAWLRDSKGKLHLAIQDDDVPTVFQPVHSPPPPPPPAAPSFAASASVVGGMRSPLLQQPALVALPPVTPTSPPLVRSPLPPAPHTHFQPVQSPALIGGGNGSFRGAWGTHVPPNTAFTF